MEEDLTLGGQHTIQYINDVWQNYTLETYAILLTSITPTNSIKNQKEKERKVCCGSRLHGNTGSGFLFASPTVCPRCSLFSHQCTNQLALLRVLYMGAVSPVQCDLQHTDSWFLPLPFPPNAYLPTQSTVTPPTPLSLTFYYIFFIFIFFEKKYIQKFSVGSLVTW